MAGTNVEIIVPGYSTLFTRDLPYTPGAGEVADLNPFDPDSAAPLVEGEWLEVAASNGAERLTRGADASQKPCYLYFMERGRYDAQLSRKAHVVVGPHGFIFRTKLTDGGPFAIGDSVAPKTVSGKRVLAAYSTAGVYAVGHVIAKSGDWITVQYAPHKI
jgi:hypothetical protein